MRKRDHLSRLAGLRYCALMSVLVRLMGAFSVEVDGRILDQGDFRRRSAAAVVKILALAPHRRMHREQIMDYLWPQLPLQDAANQLHKAALRAAGHRRSGLCEPAQRDGHPLRRADRDRGRACVRVLASAALASGEPQAVETALDAWTGDLLPDDLYASWTFQPRQRVAMLHRELLRRAGRWAELLTVDLTDEEAHLGVAQDLLIAGDRSGALRQLDVLEQVLRDEMGIGPSPEAYDLRIQPSTLCTRAEANAASSAPARRTGPADGALLPHVGWRPTCLRHQWGGAAAGQGLQLDDAFGLRLGEPSLVALVACALGGSATRPVRRTRVWPV